VGETAPENCGPIRISSIEGADRRRMHGNIHYQTAPNAPTRLSIPVGEEARAKNSMHDKSSMIDLHRTRVSFI